MLANSNHHAMLKQVEATHAPDGRQFAVKPLLHIIEDIFQSVTGFIQVYIYIYINQQGSTQAQLALLDDDTFQSGFFDMLHKYLSFTIHKVSGEIHCKCSDGGDAHATTLRIFNILGKYAWDAKAVIAMAAFALNYGEFWVVAQLYRTNPLAKSIALLKQLQEILELDDNLKSEFEALSKPIKSMLNLVKCIVEFEELPSQYISPETPETMTATAVYWTIRSIVACSAQIMGLAGMGHDYIVSTTESWEISSLANRTDSVHTHLTDQIYLCYKMIDEKGHIETHQALVKLNETAQSDNMNYLKALIYDKDDQQPLLDGSTKNRVSLNVLWRKNVLLLISDPDVSLQELLILEQMYQESRKHPTRTESQYEVVWMPVVDRTNPWTEKMNEQFETKQGKMPWYSIHHPLMVNPAVISYFKEHCHFKRNPILVVLDIQGKVVNSNALHMMWIWDSLAFPFTSAREEDLWSKEVWRLELLTGSIDPAIPVWEDERKFVCLYGGEDMEWIRKFTYKAQKVADEIGLPLELVYVGKSNSKETVRRNMATIAVERLSHTLQDIPLIWLFWVRLESMWHSKMKHNHCKNDETDPILQEIMTILSFDGSNHCWAGIYRGSEMAKAKGETILNSFIDFPSWKKNANDISFIPALNQHLLKDHSPHHCNHLVLLDITCTFPERVVCSECNSQMENFIIYRCSN
ncbi:hypothetical protein EZV62_017470 [Acer yangbiense]|uniref:Sieve element occlusion N-terminal domain-containing protein n=1 Tax=Acer yangbiense TaxID=1000413 RepID=A0A5C7HGM0_9ROSI|nr:hypothetical protein EZV62_017470 [Acer yangbiense]